MVMPISAAGDSPIALSGFTGCPTFRLDVSFCGTQTHFERDDEIFTCLCIIVQRRMHDIA